MIKQTYFISTGELNAMFTLNVQRMTDDASLNQFLRPHYICNLAAAGDENFDRAVEKAKAYADAMRDRIGETEEFKVVFGGVWDEPTNKRMGKLSVRETNNMIDIMDGRFPFGKHAGTLIKNAPESYILYFADMFGKEGNNEVIDALAAKCQGIALENGYIAKREEARAERAAVDAKSNFVGTVGDRIDFEGEVIMSIYKTQDWGDGYWINKVRVGDDIVTYMGNKSFGDKGTTVKFKARIKAHNEFNGIKETKISHPKLV